MPPLSDDRKKTIVSTYLEVGYVGQTSIKTGHSRETVKKVLNDAGIDTSTPLGDQRITSAAVASTGAGIPEGDPSTEELLRAEIADLRSALTRQRKGDVKTERIITAIESALADAELPKSTFTPVSQVAPTGAAHHRQLLQLSDFHGGEVVSLDNTGGLNEYDWQIMDDRVEEMLHGVLSHKKYSPELTGLDISFGGDMVSGNIHDELANTNQYPLAEQGVKMGIMEARIIEFLAPHYEEIRVLSVPGNHPRLVKAPAAKNTHDNMDWVSAMIAKVMTESLDNVSSFVVGSSTLIHQIAGLNVYVMHGDGIRSSMPGVPWGGIMRRVNEIERMQTVDIDHYLVHHFHSPNIVQGGRILVNGALKGVDEWVLKNFGGGERPTQLLTTFDERRSRLTDVKLLTPSAGVPQ